MSILTFRDELLPLSSGSKILLTKQTAVRTCVFASSAYSSILKIEAVCSSETWVNSTRLHYITSQIIVHRGENLNEDIYLAFGTLYQCMCSCGRASYSLRYKYLSTLQVSAQLASWGLQICLKLLPLVLSQVDAVLHCTCSVFMVSCSGILSLSFRCAAILACSYFLHLLCFDIDLHVCCTPEDG
jgi:hypothetical protein